MQPLNKRGKFLGLCSSKKDRQGSIGHLIGVYIFCCFSCENFLVGQARYWRHAKDCCAYGPPKGHRYGSPTSRTGTNSKRRWINCDKCLRQQSLAGKFDDSPLQIPFVVSPLKWARLVALAITSSMAKAALRQCSSQLPWKDTIGADLLSMLG